MSPHFASGAVVVAVVVFMAAAGVGAGGTGFIGQVLPDVPLETGLFGASIEINGDVVVVGAPSAAGDDAGLVHSFWVNPASRRLLSTGAPPVQGVAGDKLGTAIANVGGAGLIAVSAPGIDNPANADGVVYLYQVNQSTGAFALVGNATNPDVAAPGSNFGSALVAVGSTLVVGDDQGDVPGYPQDSGVVFVFSINATSASLSFECKAFAVTPTNMAFGRSVDAYGDYVVVGAPTDVMGADVFGSAHLFKINSTSGCLDFITRIDDPSPIHLKGFGSAVAIRQDVVVVSSAGSVTSGIVGGEVLLFSFDGASVALMTTLAPAITTPGYGHRVVLTSDWRLYVGSPLENIGADNAGAVFVMAVNATSFEVGEADVMAVPDGQQGENLGTSVAVSGSLAVVGAMNFDEAGTLNSGAAYGFWSGRPTGVLTVDAAYCADRGVPMNGTCIATALAEAGQFDGAVGLVMIAPGEYPGCPVGGSLISRSDLIVTTTEWPNIVPGDSPSVVWSCDYAQGTRHLHLSGSHNITIAGIGFVRATGADSHGGAVLVEDSTDVLFQGCAFEDTAADGDAAVGGALACFDSTVTVVGAMASNTSSAVSGGFVFASGGSLAVFDSEITAATSTLGGAVYMTSGEVSGSSFDHCSAKFGGAVYVNNIAGPVSVDRTTIKQCNATVSGGGLFIDAGSPAETIMVSNSSLVDCRAGAVGGGLALRTSRQVESPGVRTARLVNTTVARNVAGRGGGMYSEVDISVFDAWFEANVAVESGGGAVFQPSPCLTANARLVGTTFVQNQATHFGGGAYALSVGLSVVGSTFESNTARHGAGLATDCAPEICVGELPRDTCGGQSTNLTASTFESNRADGDGAGVYASNQALRLASPGTSFNGNGAGRGAAVFAEPSVSVYVDGLAAGPVSDKSLFDGAGNLASAYGAGIASSPEVSTWSLPPTTGFSVMAGANLCRPNGGCVATLVDHFGNTPTTPTVVEVLTVTPNVSVVDGPQYVLVANGASDPIADLAIRLVAGGGGAPDLSESVASSFAISIVGQPSSATVLSVVSTHCPEGFGRVASNPDGSGSVWCAACGPGTFSATASWDVCAVCADGSTTGPDEVEARSCDWCAPGYGLDGDGECAACVTGTFSPNETLGLACTHCAPGLTTDGPGETVCAAAAPQDVNALVIIVTAVMALVAVVALVVSCVRKRDAKHGAIFTVILSIYDVITDYLFLVSMVNLEDSGGGGGASNLGTLIVVSAGSIGAAFLINLLLTAFVLLRERRHSKFAKWMRGNVVVVAVAAVLGTTNVSVLGALSSGVFDVDATRAPFSRETRDLIDFGGVASVLFEDAPQLVVAIAFLGGPTTAGENVMIVYLTILASAVSVLTGLFLRLILCCVVGVGDDGGSGGSGDGHESSGGIELHSVNPSFDNGGEGAI